MPTYNDQLNDVNALTNSLVYENSVRAITGTNHNLQELGQNQSCYDNLVAYDNYSYKVVRTYATDTANGQSLRDAYADAVTLTPGGNALSVNNRVALLIPPGTYALGTSGLTLDTQFVDLIGLGRADETIITSVSNTGTGLGTIIQTTNDIKFRNLTIQNTADTYAAGDSTDDSGYAPQGVYPDTEFTDCIFRNPSEFTGAPFMRLGVEYGGSYQNCRGADGTFISVFFAGASGSFFNCHYSGPGFGYQMEASGVFTDCSCLDGFGYLSDATGIFARCTAFNSGFGSSGNASGRFTQCTALTSSFGYGTGVTCSGTFNSCRATQQSFGSSTSDALFQNCHVDGNGFGPAGFTAGTQTLAGTYRYCSSDANGFGLSQGATLSGNFINCTAGDGSFGGAVGCTLSGTFVGCSSGDNSFGINDSVISGTISNCTGGDLCFGSSQNALQRPSVSGTISNCSAKDQSFGYQATSTTTALIENCSAIDFSFRFALFYGTMSGCSAGIGSFPAQTTSTARISSCYAGAGGFSSGEAEVELAGEYTNCTAGAGSFAASGTGSGFLILSGKFKDCHAGDGSFATGPGGEDSIQISGTFINCTAGAGSFGALENVVPGSHTEAISGYLENCHAGPNSFAPTATGSKTGTLVNCSVRADGVTTQLADVGPLSGTMQNCSWVAPEAGEPALLVSTGAKVYGGIYRAGAGAAAGISSDSPATVSIANILTNVALGGSITNNISSPNVIVDSDI